MNKALEAAIKSRDAASAILAVHKELVRTLSIFRVTNLNPDFVHGTCDRLFRQILERHDLELIKWGHELGFRSFRADSPLIGCQSYWSRYTHNRFRKPSKPLSKWAIVCIEGKVRYVLKTKLKTLRYLNKMRVYAEWRL